MGRATWVAIRPDSVNSSFFMTCVWLATRSFVLALAASVVAPTAMTPVAVRIAALSRRTVRMRSPRRKVASPYARLGHRVPILQRRLAVAEPAMADQRSLLDTGLYDDLDRCR